MGQTKDIPLVFVVLMGIWFGGLVLLIIAGLINNSKYLLALRKLISHLKENHPEIYKSLGEPKLISARPKDAFGTLKFVRTFLRSSYDVDDPQLESMKSTTAKLLKRGYILFAVAVMWFLTFPIFFVIAVKLAG